MAAATTSRPLSPQTDPLVQEVLLLILCERQRPLHPVPVEGALQQLTPHLGPPVIGCAFRHDKKEAAHTTTGAVLLVCCMVV